MAKAKIVVTQRIFPEIGEKLKTHFQAVLSVQEGPVSIKALAPKVKDADGILTFLTDNIDAAFLEKTPNLKIISNFAVGFDNIDIGAASSRRIFVSNTPGVLTESCADLTFALVLALVRKIPQADQFVKNGKFKGWRPDLFLGRELNGKILGILGLGRIGKAVVRRAKAFGMEVIYFDTARSQEVEEELGIRFVDIEEFLSRSDVVTIHAALTKGTFHMIGEKELAFMKPTAYLVNTARGPIIDEKALFKALKNKRLAGAGLDVYEKEPEITPGLAKLPNVVLLPHIASATVETRTRMANMAADNLIAFFKGQKPPPNCVNPKLAEKF